MAWNRTSLSLIGFGFTIYKFFESFHGGTPGLIVARAEGPRNLGLALITVGAVGTLIALWQYWQIVRYLAGREFEPNGTREGIPQWSLTFIVACLSAVIGLVTIVWMLAGG
jgi:putative membrane protein